MNLVFCNPFAVPYLNVYLLISWQLPNTAQVLRLRKFAHGATALVFFTAITGEVYKLLACHYAAKVEAKGDVSNCITVLYVHDIFFMQANLHIETNFFIYAVAFTVQVAFVMRILQYWK